MVAYIIETLAYHKIFLDSTLIARLPSFLLFIHFIHTYALKNFIPSSPFPKHTQNQSTHPFYTFIETTHYLIFTSLQLYDATSESYIQSQTKKNGSDSEWPITSDLIDLKHNKISTLFSFIFTINIEEFFYREEKFLSGKP